MKTVRYYRERQRSPIFVALLLFELILVLLQLWLFVSALEGIQDGKMGMVVPGAIVSVVCLVVNTWMLIGVTRADKSK